MTSPHLTDRLHLSPVYNHILIDLGDLNNPMTPSEIEEGDHLLIPNKNPAKNKFQVYTMYKHVDKKIRPVQIFQKDATSDDPFPKIPQNHNSPIILHTKNNITSQGNIPLYQSVHTDIVLAIKPEFAEAIRTKKKNHEYQKYKIEPTVIRFWLYETEPVNAIQYVISVGSIKTPGQVQDSTGLGNDDFDKGFKNSKSLTPKQYSNPIYVTRKTQENNLTQIYKYLTQDKIPVIQNLQAQ